MWQSFMAKVIETAIHVHVVSRGARNAFFKISAFVWHIHVQALLFSGGTIVSSVDALGSLIPDLATFLEPWGQFFDGVVMSNQR